MRCDLFRKVSPPVPRPRTAAIAVAVVIALPTTSADEYNSDGADKDEAKPVDVNLHSRKNGS